VADSQHPDVSRAPVLLQHPPFLQQAAVAHLVADQHVLNQLRQVLLQELGVDRHQLAEGDAHLTTNTRALVCGQLEHSLEGQYIQVWPLQGKMGGEVWVQCMHGSVEG